MFSIKERKIIVILMLVNCFALFVNYFGLSLKFKVDNYYFCFFTNSVRSSYYYGGNLELFEQYKWEKKFYPFVNFYDSWHGGYYFNGLFPYFDYTEFLVYTFLIFGFFIAKNIITDNSNVASIRNEKIDVSGPVVKNENSEELRQLENLYNLGILTKNEYHEKLNKLAQIKVSFELEKSLEFNQLKNLYESGILSKDEFENKIEKLKKIIKHEIKLDFNEFVIDRNKVKLWHKLTSFDNVLGKIIVYEIISDNLSLNGYILYKTFNDNRYFVKVDDDKMFYNSVEDLILDKFGIEVSLSI